MTHGEVYKVVERALEAAKHSPEWDDTTESLAWVVSYAVWKKWGTLSDS